MSKQQGYASSAKNPTPAFTSLLNGEKYLRVNGIWLLELDIEQAYARLQEMRKAEQEAKAAKEAAAQLEALYTKMRRPGASVRSKRFGTKFRVVFPHYADRVLGADAFGVEAIRQGKAVLHVDIDHGSLGWDFLSNLELR